MRRSLLAIAVGLLAAVGAVVLSVRPVVGSITSAPPAPLSEVDVNVRSIPPVDANITNEYVPIGMGATGPRLEAEVTGPSGGPVTIDGTVAMTAQSIAALNGRFCTPGAQKKQGITGTVAGLPPIPGDGGTGAQPGRTSISLAYPDQAGTTFLACYASGLSGGTNPDCALPIAGATTEGPQLPQGGVLDLEVSDAYVLRCIACTSAGTPSASTVVVSYVEQDCNQ